MFILGLCIYLLLLSSHQFLGLEFEICCNILEHERRISFFVRNDGKQQPKAPAAFSVLAHSSVLCSFSRANILAGKGKKVLTHRRTQVLDAVCESSEGSKIVV